MDGFQQHGTSGDVSHNYSIGNINVSGTTSNIGGIIGRPMTTYTSSHNYYLAGKSNVELNNSGESKTEEEMKTQAFVDLLNTGLEEPVWTIIEGENNGYPTFIK